MTEQINIGKKSVSPLLVDRPGASDEARADILEAAASAFKERGYDATSIDDVADLLGASKGRIYHYYRSKTDILLDLHLESLRILIERVSVIGGQAALCPTDRIHAMCVAHAIVVMTRINYQKTTMLGLNHVLLSVLAPYQDAARQRVNDLRDEYENLFAATICEGMESGEFRALDPQFATKPVLGALNYLAIWYDEDSEETLGTVDEISRALADYCVNGLVGP